LEVRSLESRHFFQNAVGPHEAITEWDVYLQGSIALESFRLDFSTNHCTVLRTGCGVECTPNHPSHAEWDVYLQGSIALESFRSDFSTNYCTVLQTGCGIECTPNHPSHCDHPKIL
jgi:hypothetical protein